MYNASAARLSKFSGKRILAGVVVIGELDASSPEAVLSAASYRTMTIGFVSQKRRHRLTTRLSKSHTQFGACSSMTSITAAE
jgi:hypothetical protein